jgi:hypothetical protein
VASPQEILGTIGIELGANMEETKHTPWQKNNEGSALHDETTELIDADGKTVLEIGWGGFACESDPGGAYPILKASEEAWRLILAAPALLSACQTLLARVESDIECDGANGRVREGSQGRAAIALATESP